MINSEIAKTTETHTELSENSFFSRFLNVFPIFGVCLCALICLFIGFSQKPQVYPVDYGQYQWILPDVGLTWTAEDLEQGDLQFDHPVTTFDYTHFSWSNLFTPNAGNSLVYQVAVVRLFTEPFGLRFEVKYLTIVSAAFLLSAVVLMTVGLRRLFPRAWFIPAIIVCIVFMSGNFCSMFRGLYPEGQAVIYTLLFAAVLIYICSLSKPKQVRGIPALIFVSFLMLKSATPMIVFLPFVVVIDLIMIISLLRGEKRFFLTAAVSFLFFIAGISSTLKLASDDPDYFSNASIYESAFNTMLPAFEKPESLLIEFGLDGSYLPDVGKSFYLDEEAYAHNPRNPDEAAEMFSRVTADDLVQLYLLHPELLQKVLAEIPLYYERFFENIRYRVLGDVQGKGVLSRSESSPLLLVYQMLPHSYRLFLITQIILLIFGAVLVLLSRDFRFLLLSLFSACCAAYLPFCVMLNGYSLAPQYILYQHFMEMIPPTLILLFLLSVVPYVEQWISKYMMEPYIVEPVAKTGVYDGNVSLSLLKKAGSRFLLLAESRTLVTVLTFVLGSLMLLMVYLPEDHPVSINNGDFGRLMEQMDITWPGRIYYDPPAQSGHQAIEDYQFTAPFNFLKLTPLKPTFTLYWFTSIVRLMTEPFGRPFSTLLLSWVMGIISLCCAVKIVYDLFPLLKKWTLAAGLLLCVILYSETTLAWYNGFFGEGTILLGVLMSLTCAIHLCLMPRGGKSSLLWLLGLTFSLNIMVGAKSQMLVTVPGAVLLLAVLAVYHKPYRYDLMALHVFSMVVCCGLLAYSALGVYRSERSGDSVSSKSNMWHAWFYGIFMISDDPIGDMEKLGIDTAMAPDIGKYVQFEDDSQYVYAPLSEEADKAFHQHVSMVKIMLWYLTHPTKLWYMLDYAARITQTLYTDFRVYNGQDYSDLTHDPVDGMNFWPGWRAYWTPSVFLGYVVLYGAVLFLCIRMLLRKDQPANRKILCTIPLFVLLTAVIQFPISVLGNGFGDNQKQMFGFELCHDLLMSGILVLGGRYLYHLSGSWGWLPVKIKKHFGFLNKNKDRISEI